MRLTCPACGAIASLEAWENDAHCRAFQGHVAALPPAVAGQALAYLALFRPEGGRGLSWKRAAGLLQELRALVAAPQITWERKVARPNRPEAWARALERLIASPPRRLPLKSHGYLQAMAYDVADELDREAEAARARCERSGRIPERVGACVSEPVRMDFDALRQAAQEGMARQQQGAGGRVQGAGEKT